MLSIQTILHPTDFSPSSAAAFDVASSLARDYGARLVLVHVKPLEVIAGEGYLLPPVTPAVWQGLETQFSQLKPRDLSSPMERYLKEGDPASEILNMAQEVACDLIVMGSHGRTGLGRLLMGSVAEEVLRKSHCPVLTVKSVESQTSNA